MFHLQTLAADIILAVLHAYVLNEIVPFLENCEQMAFSFWEINSKHKVSWQLILWCFILNAAKQT